MQKEFSTPSVHSSRTPLETQALLKKRSADHYRREIAPHRRDIEKNIIGKLTE